MHLAVVDPRLLVRAFEHCHSRPAKLVALCMYGQLCLRAAGHTFDESDKVDKESSGQSVEQHELEAVHMWAQRVRDDAIRKKALLEDAFEMVVPGWLLLVSSPPLRDELVQCAQAAQGRGQQHVRPDRVIRVVARLTAKNLTSLEPAPLYLGPDRVSGREYLIHTAVVAEAPSLITDDEVLQLPGDLAHSDPKTRGSVRPYSLDEFVQEELPSILKFDEIDACEVFRRFLDP